MFKWKLLPFIGFHYGYVFKNANEDYDHGTFSTRTTNEEYNYYSISIIIVEEHEYYDLVSPF